MSALLESLASAPTVDATRRDALDAIVRDGLPGPRSEAWKYTSLRSLQRRSFAMPGEAAPAIDEAVLAGIPAPRLVFVNGRVDEQHSDLAALPPGVTVATAGSGDMEARFAPAADGADAVFARLNAEIAAHGVLVRVADGTAGGEPLHIAFIGATADTDLAWHLRHRVELGAGATLALVEHQFDAGAHRHLANAVMQVELGADAVLEHVRMQDGTDGATSFLRTDATLAERASYRRLDVELGGSLSRHELNVRLAGTGAALVANGVLLATGRRHVDTRLGIEHVGRDTASTLQWRGIGAGRGRVVFHGGITIHAGADGSDANLSNKNLLIGDDAEVDSQPVLVIHADEVKAAHGATVGQLDPTAIFYLRSRGLAPDAARRLLTAAFVAEPLAMLGSSTTRADVQARLEAALQALEDA